MPIRTMLETFSPVWRCAAITCSSISAGVRFRLSPLRVDAQKAQPIRQPACVEMQTVLPCLYRISTLSTFSPSSNPNRNLTVPSRAETSFFSTDAAVTKAVRASFSRRDSGRSVICAKSATSFLCTHSKTCRAR